MGDALEAGVERVLDHLRRPVPGRGDLLTDDAGNTVSEIDPKEHQDCLGNAGRPYFVANDSDGRVLGGLGLDDVEEDLLPFIETDKPMEVVNAFVTNDHRGQGAGQQFLTEVQKYAVEHG